MVNVILITGVPGSGKSSVAEELANCFLKGVHIKVDDLRSMVKGGGKDPSEKWDDQTREQYYLSFENAATLTENFIDQDFKVIIDDVVHGGDLYGEWIKYFEKFNPKKILLMPSKETILNRNKTRNHFVSEDTISMLYEDFKKHDYSDWIVIDNSKQTLEETVAEIKSTLNW